MRFQSGFQWNPYLSEYKILYINVGLPTAIIVAYRGQDALGIVVNGYSYDSPSGNGWNTIMANGVTDARGNKTSDGQWLLYEIHLKMDTNGANGVLEYWVDRVRRLYRTDVNYGAHAGWCYMAIGENHAWSGNGSAAYYVDYDDLSINGITGGSGSGSCISTPTSANSADSGASSGGGCGIVKGIYDKPTPVADQIVLNLLLLFLPLFFIKIWQLKKIKKNSHA
jgi:hypothetical protein